MSNVQMLIMIDNKVKESADWIIKQMNGLLPHLDSLVGKEFGKSQIQNMQRVAKTAAGIAEMKLFIHYQMGRDERGKGWANQKDNMAFGTRLVQLLEQIDKYAGETARKESWGETERKILSLKMAERLFVYLNWHFTYKNTHKSYENGQGDNKDHHKGKHPNYRNQEDRGRV